MSKYARIINNIAIDISSDPANHFHPDIAQDFVPVPDNVEKGWILEDGQWSAPVIPDPPIMSPVYPTVSPVEFKLLWTSTERIAIKELKTSDSVIADVYEILDDPRLTCVNLSLASTQQGIDYVLAKLVEGNVITADAVATRRATILSGVFL